MTLVGFALAYAVRKGWMGTPRSGFVSAEAAESAGGQLETAVDILTLAEAIDMRAMYASTTLVSMRAPNLRLFQEAACAGHFTGLRS